MLMPKKVRYRKQQRGRTRGNSKGQTSVGFGEYGVQALEPGWITARQIEAARVAMTRHIKRGGKVWINVFPDKPVTEKPAETRMGSGKGNPEHWVAVVRPGRVLFELSYSDAKVAREAIERAIQKGCGSDGDANFIEIVYEGYGAAGVAVLCVALTDNRNRTVGEVRKIFEVAGGNLGSTGCVSWMFERKGLFTIDKSEVDEDTLFELALEAGADDVEGESGMFQVTSPVESYQEVLEALQAAGAVDMGYRRELFPPRRSEFDHVHHERTEDIVLEISRNMFLEYRRCEWAKLLAPLDLRIDDSLHIWPGWICENGSITQRSRPPLTATLKPADDEPFMYQPGHRV